MSGLGLLDGAEVWTTRTRSGVGRPTLCVDGRRWARLPRVARGEVVGAASANGRYVAWRLARVGAVGRVRVGRLVRGRVRNVREVRTVEGSHGNLVDGSFVVTETGTAAWTVRTAKGRRSTTVWVRHARPVAVPRAGGVRVGSADEFGPAGRVWVLDDQHVVVAGVRRRYRPARPGKCPRLFGATWRSLGGWETAVAGREEIAEGSSFDREVFHVTCDPVRGQYVDATTTRDGSTQYDHGEIRMGTQARNGDLLVQERVGSAAFGDETSVKLSDVATGTVYEAPGLLDVPGVPRRPPAEYPNNGLRSIGAAIVPGATAWITSSPASGSDGRPARALWLDDAAGTRRLVAGSAPLADLELTPTRVSWTMSGVATSAPVVPRTERPYGVLVDPR